MYQRILFPTDGSAGSEAAMGHVVDLASTYGATVHVLYVADSENELSHMVMRDDDTGFSGMVKPDDVEMGSGMTAPDTGGMQRLETAGQELVAAVADEFAAHDVETVTEVREGNPYRAIVNYADEADVDLVVMPTHGRRGIDRYLLGSVTEKVVRTARPPVLTVRLGDSEDEAE
ncbi:universal stress protein [Halomicroarcula sp. F13]|uniref:Universal stress protein n=1 Tax=Haloarcula rubra TaxID=2487747 RepID=A0AAW4PMG5_9EURY|nr:universal stress protein [Halomicroarcula rubra]MBX0321628.1 universal stress protein [Halomicroarcula rubra]